MSMFGFVMGMPFIQNMYIADWWQPNFIFDFPIKIEDLLFGFGTVGVISSLYSILKSKNRTPSKTSFSAKYKVIAVFCGFTTLFACFYILNLHSLWASVIGISVGIIFVVLKKPGFLKYAILNGILISVFFLPIYLLAIYINPQFISNEWFLNQLSGITLLTIPIEEFIWYFFTGLGISGLQEMLD